MGDEYRRFWIASSDAGLCERLLAEAFEAGAEGAEEVEGTGACVYARAAVIEDVRRALAGVVEREVGEVGDVPGAVAEIGPAEAVPAVDWAEEWKRGLGPIVISERLVVRPPFAAYALGPGQREIVIDPGQAFGTGTHASTHLCLEWIDQLLLDEADRTRHARMLDVGTGSGVLALAARALGAKEALGFDLDPVAIEAAVAAAADNGLAGGVRLVCVPIEAIESAPGFGLVVANLLKRELLPIAEEIARRLAPGGSLVLAGLLEQDGDEVARCFAPHGLVERDRRVRADAVGRWIAPRYVRSDDATPSRSHQSA
jgi:ribosomal protein L11 methyltransferase